MKKALILVCISTAGFAVISFQLREYNDVSLPGKYSIRLSDSKKPTVMCLIKVVKYPGAMSREGWWGVPADVPEAAPQSAIADLRFKVGKKEFRAPLSCYADLAEISGVTLRRGNQTYSLLMLGGDGGYGYEALVVFTDTAVTAREVRYNTFEPGYWERTEYHENTTTGE